MVFKFIFDEESVNYTVGNREMNLMYLRHVGERLNLLLEKRGYVYANQVYEEIGVEWDPDVQSLNKCFKKRFYDRIPIEIEERPRGDFKIIIKT
jgi:hypothetical protein